MICTLCKATLESRDISAALVMSDSTEIHAKCECGALFSAWIDHTAWAHGDNPVYLGDARPAKKPLALHSVKKGRRG